VLDHLFGLHILYILFSFTHLFACLVAMAEKDNKPAQDVVVLATETDDELSQAIDVEKLGRQRPAAFSSAWMEVAFVVSILGSLSMAVGLLSLTYADKRDSRIPQYMGHSHMLVLAVPYRKLRELIMPH
jgi:hypothetical protein